MTTTLENRSETPEIQLPTIHAAGIDTLPIKLRLPSAVIAAGPDACAAWFWDICAANEESPWQMELNANGELELMPPTYEPSDVQENITSSEVYLWDKEQGFPGTPTGPTSAYRLSNGALRAPDAAWAASGECSRQATRRSGRAALLP